MPFCIKLVSPGTISRWTIFFTNSKIKKCYHCHRFASLTRTGLLTISWALIWSCCKYPRINQVGACVFISPPGTFWIRKDIKGFVSHGDGILDVSSRKTCRVIALLLGCQLWTTIRTMHCHCLRCLLVRQETWGSCQRFDQSSDSMQLKCFVFFKNVSR